MIQGEMFRDSNGQAHEFAPERIPRLTPFMLRYLAVLKVRELTEPKIKPMRAVMGRSTDVRCLKRLIREGLVVAQVGMPAIYRITRLGEIAWSLRGKLGK